jgi:ribosomal-protein-alanine N-acetyltransferase
VTSGVPFLVAEAGGLVAGYVVAHCAADEGEILNLGVAVAHRRRGVGRELVRAVLAALGARGVRAVYLEVRESNTGARQLYEGLGFGEVGRRARYYRRPVEDAVVLCAAIGPAGVSAKL